LENTAFGTIGQLPVQFTTIYYTQPSNVSNDANGAEAHMAPVTTYANDILEYGAAVGRNSTSGAFSAVVCEQTSAASTAVPTPGDLATPGNGTLDATCTTAGTRVQ